MRLALAIASFVILIVHGVVFYDQFVHRWEKHQTAYFEQARSLSTRADERAEFEARAPKIEQIIVTSFGDTRVDRCATCHIAADDPRFAGHAQPLKTHPYSTAMGDVNRNGRWERRHKFTDFGCTVCHDGQGRGVDAHYSHGEDEFWPEPLLGYITQANWRKDFEPHLKGKEYMEANCAQCHTTEGFAGTPNVNRGRKLFYAMNCYGCHKIDGLSEGTLGPDLTEAGKKFKIDYLWESIAEPRANLTTSFMPKFNLSQADVKALVIFLKSRRGVNFAETSLDRYKAHIANSAVVLPPGTAGEEAGEQLIDDRACTACHKLKDKDGGVAPDLTYEGLIRDRDWLMAHFKNPKSRVPDSIMPSFRFPDEDFERLSAYLGNQKTPPPPASAETTYKNLCARCHGEKGDGAGKAAWYLDPAPRDFTKPSFMNTKSRERFIQSIQDGVAGTSMPPWGKILKDDQLNDVLTYIQKTFAGGQGPGAGAGEAATQPKQRPLPDRNPVAVSKQSIAHGEQIYLQRCTGCHGRKADGKGPNSLDITPRPRNLRNTAFVENLTDRRMAESILYGVQGTAMPPWIDYGLTQQDVGDIMNFIRSINRKTGSQQYASR